MIEWLTNITFLIMTFSTTSLIVIEALLNRGEPSPFVAENMLLPKMANNTFIRNQFTFKKVGTDLEGLTYFNETY